MLNAVNPRAGHSGPPVGSIPMGPGQSPMPGPVGGQLSFMDVLNASM